MATNNPTRITGVTNVELTDAGKIGAGMLVLGPIATSAGWWQYSSTLLGNARATFRSDVADPTLWLWVAGLGGIAGLLGFVVFLSGFRLSHSLTIRD